MKEKRIVYLARWRTIGLIAISILLTLAGIVLKGNIYGTVFFGLCGLIVAFPLYNPNVKVIWIGTQKYKESLAADFKRKQEDTGIFSYTKNGFEITVKNTSHRYPWTNITCLTAYKKDNMTTDCICMDIFCADGSKYSIDEETPGWYMFVKTTKAQFPQINKLWDVEITTPAFKTNFTLIYDSDSRKPDDVVKIYYPAKSV
jgi:hypothetical protein